MLIGRKADDLVRIVLGLLVREVPKCQATARRKPKVARDADREAEVQGTTLVIEQELLTEEVGPRDGRARVCGLRRHDGRPVCVHRASSAGTPMDDLYQRG